MKELLKSFWTDESGQGLTEYALIIALVALLLIAVVWAFKDAIANVFNKMKSTLDTVPSVT
jgi:pilus assembly protein Flp/PilA